MRQINLLEDCSRANPLDESKLWLLRSKAGEALGWGGLGALGMLGARTRLGMLLRSLSDGDRHTKCYYGWLRGHACAFSLTPPLQLPQSDSSPLIPSTSLSLKQCEGFKRRRQLLLLGGGTSVEGSVDA